MPRKFENETRYLCRACGKATPKEEWREKKISGEIFHLCPFCGCIQDASIANKMPLPPEPEVVPPEPKASGKK